MATDENRDQAKSLFVVFEGADGVGKSTQIPLVEERLKKIGLNTITTREPGGTPLGETVRNVVKQEHSLYPWSEFYLIQAARIDHIGKVIEPALRKGCIVLVDRFTPSSLVYQGVLRDLGVSNVLSAIDRTEPAVDADLTLVLDSPKPMAGFEFSSSDNFEREGLSSWQKIRVAYLELAPRFGWKIIDANQDQATVTEDLITAITHLLKVKRSYNYDS